MLWCCAFRPRPQPAGLPLWVPIQISLLARFFGGDPCVSAAGSVTEAAPPSLLVVGGPNSKAANLRNRATESGAGAKVILTSTLSFLRIGGRLPHGR